MRAGLGILALTSLCLLVHLSVQARPLAAQDPGVVGAAIAEACQGVPDPTVHAILAGTVVDSVSAVALPNARVFIAWSEGEDEDTRTSEVRTDTNGFFAFCHLPVGTEVEVTAELRVTGNPVQVVTEAGMLHVVQLSLALSDPTRPGTIMGRIVDAETREPVQGATVFLRDMEARTVSYTNEHGYFSLGSHPWGIYTMEVSHLAYGRRASPVRVQGDMTEALEIEISQEPIQLEELVVKASSRLRNWDMDGLVRRMDAGWGFFVTRDRIEKQPAARLMDFVRDVPGLRVYHAGVATWLTVRGEPCTPQIYVDGMQWSFELEFALREFLADELEAVEVFRGSLEIPAEFRRTSEPCAVIAIWTRKVG